jgi:hypothetical protein
MNGTGIALPLASPLHHSETESETLVEICERLAFYLYYLNFVSNLFFYSLKNPQRGMRSFSDVLISKLAVKAVTAVDNIRTNLSVLYNYTTLNNRIELSVFLTFNEF